MKNTTIHKNSPFRVPEGYFEQLPASVMQRVAQIEAQKVAGKVVQKRISPAHTLYIYMRYVAGVAAAACFLLLFYTGGERTQPVAPTAEQTTPAKQQLADASASSDRIYDYFLYTTQDIYDYEANEE